MRIKMGVLRQFSPIYMQILIELECMDWNLQTNMKFDQQNAFAVQEGVKKHEKIEKNYEKRVFSLRGGYHVTKFWKKS